MAHLEIDKVKEGIEGYVAFPPDAICSVYERHKEKYSDYNILGQVLKLECKLVKTKFTDEKSVNELIKTARDIAHTILEITETKHLT